MTNKRYHSNTSSPMYPRAAVATTVQLVVEGDSNSFKYLLVQRANPPDQGKWSIPGGKIELGETTLRAAQRELQEETGLTGVEWRTDPFLTTDAIIANDETGEYAFHYVIAQCFARITVPNDGQSIPLLKPSDDALDAKWFSIQEIEDLHDTASMGVLKVIARAEELSRLNAFPSLS